MNAIFNIKRFANFSRQQMLLHAKPQLMMWGVITILYFAITMMILADSRNMNENDYKTLALIAGLFTGIVVAGNAFPYFRNKEGVLSYSTFPASNFEKYFFEFLLKFVLVFILFPILLKVATDLAIGIKRYFMSFHSSPESIERFQYMNLRQLFTMPKEPGVVGFIVILVVFAMSLAFAGASTFMKRPLVKTILFVALVSAVVGLYMYIIIEEVDIREPFFVPLIERMVDHKSLVLPKISVSVLSLWVLVYSFFRLKEKEV